MDLPNANSATVPLAVSGVLYFASGLSVVHAVDATTGKLLWQYDPQAAPAAGKKLRQGYGSRGIGYWNDKLYTATADGRLIALAAKTGKPVWSVLTVDPKDGRFITGAPRVMDGKVIIGHGGGENSSIRGYVTMYDAETGRQLWRFYTVPGNPADGFEDRAQEIAAKTWSDDWWTRGGGGAAWNAFTFDAETNTVFVGVGSGAPWNRRVRSADRGDNLFLSSIVALDATTGAYRWHYQVTPGDSWDFDAATDMHLADIPIRGVQRKVLIQASKNGFMYVIDRGTGHLLIAEKIAKVTWASSIDMASGRPIEIPGARFPDGTDAEIWPGGNGAHSWEPSAYSPKAGLLYIPVTEKGFTYNDRGISPKSWNRTPGNAFDAALLVSPQIKPDPLNNTGWLVAMNPATGRVKWRIQHAAMWNGGVLATAGGLVFQGQSTGEFDAYSAENGDRLWSEPAQAPIIGAPITYLADGTQYVTVLVGMGTSPSMYGQTTPSAISYRGQARRVLTFALDGKATLPTSPTVTVSAPPDPTYHDMPSVALQGAILYAQHCLVCHSFDVVSGGGAPDLRASGVPFDAASFDQVVRHGILERNGMPRFDEFSDAELVALRQYVRSRAALLR